MKTIADLRKLSTSDLQTRLNDLRVQLVDQKRARAAGELANPHAVKKTRREIAAVLTLLNEQPTAEVVADKEKK